MFSGIVETETTETVSIGSVADVLTGKTVWYRWRSHVSETNEIAGNGTEACLEIRRNAAQMSERLCDSEITVREINDGADSANGK